MSRARPILDGVYGATANPVRLMFMMGLIWRLAQESKDRLELLEVGSWCGASVLTWAEAIQIYFAGHGRIACVDAWESYYDRTVNTDGWGPLMEKALVDGHAYDIFRHNIAFVPAGIEVDILRGYSQDVLPRLPSESFDVVYLDGDHVYDVVKADIANAARLVRDGGVICGDDLELQAHQCASSMVEGGLGIDTIRDAVTGELYHPGVTRAVGEVFGRVSCWHGFWAMRKDGAAWRPISLDGMPSHVPTHLSPKSLMELKTFLMKNGLY